MSKSYTIDLRQLALATLAPVLALAAMPAAGADMVGLDKSNRLVRFANSKPGAPIAQPPKRKRVRPACGHVDNARALTTCPQAQQQQKAA